MVYSPDRSTSIKISGGLLEFDRLFKEMEEEIKL